MEKNEVDIVINNYKNKIYQMEKLNKLSYDNIKKISNNKGVYLVYYKDEIIYIGKTTRTGKVRFNEMGSDFRSHTLNRKLLLNELKSKKIYKISSEIKEDLIKNNIITIDEFKKIQEKINIKIRNDFQFKFIEENDPNSLEHFLIAVFNPKYND